MKRYLVALAALCLLSGYTLAADMNMGDMSVKSDTWTVKQGEMMKDYVMMSDGKMWVVKNGVKSMMNSDMTMANGTMVMKDGAYRLKDGTKMMMMNGDKMNMDGTMMTGQ